MTIQAVDPQKPSFLSRWSWLDNLDAGARWQHPSGMRAISSVDPVEGRGLEKHVSFSFNGGAPPRLMLVQAKTDWGITDEWEEDSHGGKAIHFWLPLDKDKRGECPCKEDEKSVPRD